MKRSPSRSSRALEPAGDLAVDEGQQAVTGLHQRHLDTEGGEGRGVLAADHPASHHRHAPRDPAHVQDGVRVVDQPHVEGDAGRVVGRGARGDEDDARLDGEVGAAVRLPHANRVRVAERGLTRDHLDAVPVEVASDDAPLALDHHVLAIHEVPDGEVFLQRVIHAVEAAVAKAREVERGLAQRLGRDGAGVDARAAQVRPALDQRDPCAEVRRLRGALLAGGAGADHHEVVRASCHRFRLGQAARRRPVFPRPRDSSPPTFQAAAIA